MKNLILLLLIGLGFNSYAQETKAVNYKLIEKNIKKKKSPFSYTILFEKFKAADSTMTIEEKRHLYYGYTFHENYSPYETSAWVDSIYQKLGKENLEQIDYYQIIKFAENALEEDPFNLRAMNQQLKAYRELQRFDEFDERLIQLTIIIDALMSSGNGSTKKDAFFVITTSHEYDLLGILGFQFGGSQSLIQHYDYLTVEENEYDLEGLYFDVTPCLNALSKLMK